MEQEGRECGWSCPAVKLDLLVASLFALVCKTAGNRLSICGEHLFHCPRQGGCKRSNWHHLLRGSGQGWAIVMNIMCKYERRETKGCFCYANVVLSADRVVICCEQLYAHWTLYGLVVIYTAQPNHWSAGLNINYITAAERLCTGKR